MGTEVDRDNGKKVEESIRLLIEGESVRMTSSKQTNATICMVPDTLRNLNPLAYTPRITSIGPLHEQDKRLRAMEEHKVSYMYRLFCRTVITTNKGIEQITRECVQAVLALLPDVRARYAPSLTDYEDLKLAEIMVIDGCFILELLCSPLYRIGFCGPIFDPIFDNILVLRDIKHDLLLLENQIPLFVLEILFTVTVKQFFMSKIPLTYIVFSFFNDMSILNTSKFTLRGGPEEHCHILGLLQSCYRPRAAEQDMVPNISYSAAEIADAGVTFKAQTDEEYDLLAVNFKQSSLVLPELCIKDSTHSLLRNLIAYEQCYPLSRHYVTSFAFLMDRLIDTKDDASLLVRSKVIHHELGAIEDITNLFNKICNGVALRDFYYTAEWKQLDDYCNRFWPRILILLRRIFKSTTWKTLTVLGAAILFTLSSLQTIYTVRD